MHRIYFNELDRPIVTAINCIIPFSSSSTVLDGALLLPLSLLLLQSEDDMMLPKCPDYDLHHHPDISQAFLLLFLSLGLSNTDG